MWFFSSKMRKKWKKALKIILKIINIYLSTYTSIYQKIRSIKFFKKYFKKIFFKISVIFENSIRTRMTVTLAVTVTVTVKIFAAKLTETIANIYKDLGKIWNGPSFPPFAHKRTQYLGVPKSGTTKKAFFLHIFQFRPWRGPKCDQNQLWHLNITGKLH